MKVSRQSWLELCLNFCFKHEKSKVWAKFCIFFILNTKSDVERTEKLLIVIMSYLQSLKFKLIRVPTMTLRLTYQE